MVVAIGAETRKSSTTHRIYVRGFPREYGEVRKNLGKKCIEMEGNAIGIELDFGSAEIEGNLVKWFGNVSFVISRMDDYSRDFLHGRFNGEEEREGTSEWRDVGNRDSYGSDGIVGNCVNGVLNKFHLLKRGLFQRIDLCHFGVNFWSGGNEQVLRVC